LIYASLGTLQNRQQHLFAQIAEACAHLPAQLVLSLGGGAKVDSLGKVPGAPILVDFAPQLELLERATLCITHAGLNTTLECLSQGVPMVAIPLANDQPGVAARIAWSGAGLFIPPAKLNPVRLRAAIEEVLSRPRYRENSQRLRAAIQSRDGLAMAAVLIEQVVQMKKPVVASEQPR
jgi:MGT family glycosyltransferase